MTKTTNKTIRKKAAPSRKKPAIRPTVKKSRVDRGVKSNTKTVSVIKTANCTSTVNAATLASPNLSKVKPGTKTHIMLTLLERSKGATAEELMTAVGWQKHSVHGFLAGTVKKKLGLPLCSEKQDAGPRRYRIANGGE